MNSKKTSLFPFLLSFPAKSLHPGVQPTLDPGLEPAIFFGNLNFCQGIFYSSIQSNTFYFFQENHFNCSSGKLVTGGLSLSVQITNDAIPAVIN